MYHQCPACNNTLSVGAEHLGQLVQCPHCQEAIQIPAPQQSVAALRPASEPTKKCPHCGETILKVALRCKFCKSAIPQGYDEESAADRLRAKESLITQQAATADRALPYAVRGWFQISTLVACALTGLAIVAAVIGIAAGDRSPWFSLVAVGTVLGIICLAIALLLGARDLFAAKYFGRRTPAKGAKAFFGGLCAKRYLFGYYCVLDADKDDSPRLRPGIAILGIEPQTYSFDDFAGFRDYWKSLLHTSGTQAAVKAIRVERTQGDFAEVSADIKLTQQSTSGFLVLGVLGALLFAKRESLSVTKLFRCVDGQWCAVNGEVDSGEDRFGFKSLIARK